MMWTENFQLQSFKSHFPTAKLESVTWKNVYWQRKSITENGKSITEAKNLNCEMQTENIKWKLKSL